MWLNLIFSSYIFDPRILIDYAILLLVIAGALTFQKSDYSQNYSISSYWLISTGVMCLIIDSYRRTKSGGLVS
jgi:hypothetical protein